MSYLLYSSNEMFSSTTLIRQSKLIFDKLNTNEITKAVILRDGKPSFVMLEFDKYEMIMANYEKLLNAKDTTIQTNMQTKEQIIIQKEIIDETIEKINTDDELDFKIELGDDEKDTQTAQIKEFWNK
jgi:hypothetical protein